MIEASYMLVAIKYWAGECFSEDFHGEQKNFKTFFFYCSASVALSK